MNVNERIDAMTDAVTSGRPLAEVAAERGIPLNDLEVWAALYGAATREVKQRSQRRWRGVAIALAATAGLAGGLAFAGSCASILPAPLVTMCQDEPALASEINSNFQTVRNWILSPPGPVSATSSVSATTSITAGTSVTAAGTLSGNDLHVRGSAGAANQGLQAFWNTLNPGLGRTEIVNNRGLGGGGLYFYQRQNPGQLANDPIFSISPASIGGTGSLCLTHTDCVDTANFGCGGGATCPDGKFAVGETDGTGCGIQNRLRCCGLRLTNCQ